MTTDDKFEQEGQPIHPGWQPVSAMFQTPDPFFESIFFLPGYEFSSNIYAITGADFSIVDTGNDYTAFLDLSSLAQKPAEIQKIVLTHGHRDHAMGVFELLRSYPTSRENGGVELILHEAGPAELKEVAKNLGAHVIEVRGGETLAMGGRDWEVIYTPGHTIDGICLYHPSSRTVFSGDMVLPHAMAMPDENAGGRLDHYLFGVRALLGKEVENVLPGHGSPVFYCGRKVIEETYEGLMMKILGVDGKAKIPWIEGATALAQIRCLEEAVYCCDKELLLDPESRRALQLMAFCFNDLGRFHEALASLDRLERLCSAQQGYRFASVGRGYALMGLGRYEESVKWFDEALKESPGMNDALIYKGMALYLAGDYDAAMEIELFRKEFVGRFKEELRRKYKGVGAA